jgi:hypothetical protein
MAGWQDTLVRGRVHVPPRICIYGNHAIGKSTLASQFPNPIFVSTEDGLNALDVVSFPRARTFKDVEDDIRNLIRDEHDFKTAIIDTVDWLVEPLITKFVEDNHEAKELSYGKGAMYIAEEFRNVLQGLDVLRIKRQMNIVLIAHSEIRRFENPLTEPYDQFRPKLPTRCNALLQEWLDVLAFAAFRVIIKKADVGFNNTVARGITTGDRLLHFVESPAFVAKNRYPGGPKEVTMSYAELEKIVPIFKIEARAEEKVETVPLKEVANG